MIVDRNPPILYENACSWIKGAASSGFQVVRIMLFDVFGKSWRGDFHNDIIYIQVT